MKRLVLLIFIITGLLACSQNRGPGYQFELFKNTANWDLAKAAEKEDTLKMREILRTKQGDINLQEKKYGRTLLHLCIGNDKLISTRFLLEHQAGLNILDSSREKAIHEASYFVKSKKNSFEILKLLLKFGANANDIQIKKKNGDTVYVNVPLMGAVDDLDCAKLLLDSGANPYFKFHDEYLVWFRLLTGDATFNDNIYVAKYMIVDKKLPVPDAIIYTIPEHRPVDVFELVKEFKVGEDLKKQEAKQKILRYLKEINFPKSGTFKEKN